MSQLPLILLHNAGMESLDYEGSLAEMGSLLAQGKLNWIDKAIFYGRVRLLSLILESRCSW